MCGGVYCDTCTKERVCLPGFGKEPQRICPPCLQVRHEEANVEHLDAGVLTWEFSLAPEPESSPNRNRCSKPLDDHMRSSGLFEATGHRWGHGRLSGASDEFASMQEDWLDGAPHMADIKRQRNSVRSKTMEPTIGIGDQCEMCATCTVC
eukprot:TRINITY_DN2577_c0_g1_i2.p1 TRINITY_DN2577_c0_g1~~TRINITY_DN2577_c0_g1_i2.p1  ORF type:complete len:150 (-),score=18.99 TRINITY_DN2577_c0_g1_i2:134-583(-)